MASLAWDCSEQRTSPQNVQLGGCALGSRALLHAPIRRAAILPLKLNLMSLPDQPMSSRKQCPTRCISLKNVNAWCVPQLNHWPLWTGRDVSAVLRTNPPANASRAELFRKHSDRCEQTADIPWEADLNKLQEVSPRRLCGAPLSSLHLLASRVNPG